MVRADRDLDAGRLVRCQPLAVAGSKLALNHARDHGVAASLQQMSLLQSAIFDIGEMEKAITAWKTKQPADFSPLAPLEG